MEYLPTDITDDPKRIVLEYLDDPSIIQESLKDDVRRRALVKDLKSLDKKDFYSRLYDSLDFPSLLKFILENTDKNPPPDLLQKAIEKGNLESVKYLLEEKKQRIDTAVLIQSVMKSNNIDMIDYFFISPEQLSSLQADSKSIYDFLYLTHKISVEGILSNAPIYASVDFFKKIYEKYGSYMSPLSLSTLSERSIIKMSKKDIIDKVQKFLFLLTYMTKEMKQTIPVYIYQDPDLFFAYLTRYNLLPEIRKNIIENYFHEEPYADTSVFWILKKYPQLRKYLYNLITESDEDYSPEGVETVNEFLSDIPSSFEFVYLNPEEVGISYI